MATQDVKVAFIMADYGHDPTETAIPFQIFKRAGFDITFFTESGNTPECDKKMICGWTGSVLGASKSAINAYRQMVQQPEWQKPNSWTAPDADLAEFDLVFLPGGHDREIRQLLDSARAQELVAKYWQSVRHPGTKYCGAICHGVQLLAHTKTEDKKSVLHDVSTTSLTNTMESSIYWATRLFLGDYYKTYGHGTPNVEDVVQQALDNPSKQWKGSANISTPLVVEDENYNYLSGRFPGDAQALADRIVERLQQSRAT